MPTTDDEIRREAIRRTLAQHAGDAPTASTVAEATLTTWSRTAARLAPVIGARGVDALLNRSLHLTSKSYPWLSVTGDHGNSAALLTSLEARLAENETDAARSAGHALLMNFVDLLTSLIGESLTDRLLHSVWAPHEPISEQGGAP